MRRSSSAGLILAVSCALAGRVCASDETATANVSLGDSATDIASTFEAAWSQGDYTCRRSANVLIVTDKSGDCHQPETVFTFTVAGGTLNANHALDLRVHCPVPTSAVAASVDADAAGPQPLARGGNQVVAGVDMIGIDVQYKYGEKNGGTTAPIPVSVPVLSGPRLGLLGMSLAALGAAALRRRVARTTASRS